MGRRQAATDRQTSRADRRDGAAERVDAGTDRDSARGDRGGDAARRTGAARDRVHASADRDQAGVDLRHASIDGLTGAYTRSAGLLELRRELDRAARSGSPLVLAFVDVDGLKAMNDSGGHPSGDRVLSTVGEALRTCLRPYDLVIRYGGDEFVCVLAGLDPLGASVRMGAVNLRLARHQPPVSVSVGVSALEPGDTVALLVERADADLYRRRRTSRGLPSL